MRERVYIEWYDAYTLDSWQSIEDAIDLGSERYLVKSTGYILKEDSHCIIISHSITHVQVMGVLHIPKECIKKIRRFKG